MNLFDCIPPPQFSDWKYLVDLKGNSCLKQRSKKAQKMQSSSYAEVFKNQTKPNLGIRWQIITFHPSPSKRTLFLMEVHYVTAKKSLYSFERGGSLNFVLIYARIYAGLILSTSQAPATEEYNCQLCSQIIRLAPRENAALDICIGTLYRLCYHSSLNKLNPLHLMKCARNAPKRTSSTGHAVPPSKVVYEEEKINK